MYLSNKIIFGKACLYLSQILATKYNSVLNDKYVLYK
ncbi:hypothetical protein ACVW2L_001414 [Mucilaginibacter sp. HD30]